MTPPMEGHAAATPGNPSTGETASSFGQRNEMSVASLDTNPFPPTWPTTWIKGELLNVQGFQDGSYQVTRMGESYQRGKGMEFDSSFDANRFLGWWYAHGSADPRAR